MVLVLVALPAPARGATTIPVSMTDNAFSPRTVTGIVGLTGVQWNNDGAVFHSATTATHPKWFDVNLDEGEHGDLLLAYAGTFPYVCVYHPSMTGTLRVAPRVTPPGGMEGATITVTLAATDPAPFAFDVQRRVDGGRWRSVGRIAAASVDLVAGREGRWQVRVRLVDVARDRVGPWSPRASFDVG